MLAEYETTAYRLAPGFLNGTEEASGSLAVFAPGEATRERLVLERLGVHVWGRWQYFRQCFSGPWGESHQRPLSPRAQEAFLRALEVLHIEGATPSLFLTDEGHLELFWRDDQGNPIQIEFGPRESEVYIESTGIEESVPNRELNQFIVEHLVR